jgi:Flp pilus assembly protein TadG
VKLRAQESQIMLSHTSKPTSRRGAAVVEFAVLAPFLVFCFLLGIDFARVYYYSVVVTYCARDGATYGSWSYKNAQDTTGIQKAAVADDSAIAGFGNTNVSSSITYDLFGKPQSITVTVTYTFYTAASYIIGSSSTNAFTIVRSCTMNIALDTPS